MRALLIDTAADVKPVQQAARRLALASMALCCSQAWAQLVPPRTANEKALVEAVSKTMSTCFTALGPREGFRTVASPPPQAELLAAVLMAASGPRVGDGYNYLLLLHGRSNSAYVVQLGGFGASPKTYGPLPLDTRCAEPPSPPRP